MPNTEKVSNGSNSEGLLLDGAVRKFMQRPAGRAGLLCERNEFSVSAAWMRRLQDDVETSGAKSFCGYEGGIVPSTSAMFGMPNIDGGLRAVDRPQRSGAAKRRGELDTGIPGAMSLCGDKGRIVPSPPQCSACRTLMVVVELSIDGTAPGAAKRRGELDAGIRRAKSLCGYEGRID